MAFENLAVLLAKAKAAEAEAKKRAAEKRAQLDAARRVAVEKEIAQNGHLLAEAVQALTPGQTEAALLEKAGILEARIKALASEALAACRQVADLEAAQSKDGQAVADGKKLLQQAKAYGLLDSKEAKDAQAEIEKIEAKMADRRGRLARAWKRLTSAVDDLTDLGINPREVITAEVNAKVLDRLYAERARKAKAKAEAEKQALLKKYASAPGFKVGDVVKK